MNAICPLVGRNRPPSQFLRKSWIGRDDESTFCTIALGKGKLLFNLIEHPTPLPHVPVEAFIIVLSLRLSHLQSSHNLNNSVEFCCR